ncbi:DUF171-domain-containing protein [Byssothecium circinans]|uniref:DUF171-domain-containing protein n=1 Tax=Byssothecium circinans TaxID=147558 RepID=A0A6A5TLQ7_9PLEO|nr:DUF171-domain-containing protein [Byssothecium circinans]
MRTRNKKRKSAPEEEQENAVKAKKRRGDDDDDERDEANEDGDAVGDGNEMDTSKPSALFKPRMGRDWTLSMAVPGSIIANVAKPNMKTILIGRIARAAAVFCVDEIVIFDDDAANIPNYISTHYRKSKNKNKKKTKAEILDSISEEDQLFQNPDQFLYHVLSYAECPPHLRRDDIDPSLSLFPYHQNLNWAGLLPSLDMPHHLKSYEWCQYREGVAMGPSKPTARGARASPRSKGKGKAKDETMWTYIKCGLPFPVKIAAEIPPAMRVTLKFKNAEQPPSWPHLSEEECDELEVEAVSPTAPREEEGYYWGFNIRRATSISDVFTSSEFEEGYDVSIGTSERGVPLNSVLPEDVVPRNATKDSSVKRLPERFKHLLIVFGGVAGLEPAVATDPELEGKLSKETASELFDAWVNLVQGQGSRTIRTEEAVEFGLFGIKGYVDSMFDG